MSLEILANELLFDLFEYLPAVYLLRSFYGLNTRFNNLISSYFRKHRLDFRESSKNDFEIVCQVYLSEIRNDIVSLGLSDEDDIPQQIYLFRSSGWTLDRFENLRSLSFNHIRSGEVISDILLECPQLVHLNLTACYFESSPDDIRQFINRVWNLRNLIYCYLSLVLKDEFSMPIPTDVSLSIRHLTIIGIPLSVGQLIHFHEHTPQLQYLALDLPIVRVSEQIQTPIESITELNLSIVGTQSSIIENILQHMPNLTQLKLDSCYLDLDGYEWEQIIRSYLPKLEIFQLKMRFRLSNEKEKIQLLKSFQTSFWLKEHQWFIRFHFNPDDKSNMICLYTLPYNFTALDAYFPIQMQSTCANDDDYCSYDQVQRLSYRCSSQTDEIITLNLHFSNITHLSVTLPYNHHLLLLIEKLDHLSSLEVSRPNNMSIDDAFHQLQTLVNSTNHLQSLKFSAWSDAQKPYTSLIPILLETRPISRVYLRGYDHYFDDEDLSKLSHSSLGQHCQILSIKVKTQWNIIHLINSMINLRSLIVQSKEDYWQYYSTTSNDQFIQWLKENLPTTYSVKRDLRYKHSIRIWI